jgi:ABC-2 type transport system permease protein
VKAIRDASTSFVAAARIGFRDMAAFYTIRTWIIGWFSRLVIQVVFFSLFGLLLGSVADVHYRVIGNSAALVCIGAMPVVLSVVRERGAGTLAMQILTPSPFALAYIGRGICWLVVGIGSSTAAFIIAALAFQLPVAMPQALLTPVVIAVIGVSAYCLGLALGAVVMARPTLQWLAVNLGYLSVMTLSGVNVPVSYWPKPVQVLASALPLTHGLRALRLLLAGGSYAAVGSAIAAEAAVGASWLVIALFVMTLSVHNGRKNGTLELSAA